MDLAFSYQITKFFNDSSKINPNQHGGRKGHSTEVVELMSSIYDGLDEKLKVGMMAIDLSAV